MVMFLVFGFVGHFCRPEDVAKVDGEGPAPDGEPLDLVDSEGRGKCKGDVLAAVPAEDGCGAVLVVVDAAVVGIGDNNAFFRGM